MTPSFGTASLICNHVALSITIKPVRTWILDLFSLLSIDKSFTGDSFTVENPPGKAVALRWGQPNTLRPHRGLFNNQSLVAWAGDPLILAFGHIAGWFAPQLQSCLRNAPETRTVCSNIFFECQAQVSWVGSLPALDHHDHFAGQEFCGNGKHKIHMIYRHIRFVGVALTVPNWGYTFKFERQLWETGLFVNVYQLQSLSKYHD